jgi:hypothetical protein
LYRIYLQRREEKDCIVENAGDPETHDPVGQVGEGGFIAFFALSGGRVVFKVQTEISWKGYMSP